MNTAQKDEHLRQLIRNICQSNDLTIRELAKRCGLSESYLYKIMHGKGQSSRTNIRRGIVLKILNATLISQSKINAELIELGFIPERESEFVLPMAALEKLEFLVSRKRDFYSYYSLIKVCIRNGELKKADDYISLCLTKFKEEYEKIQLLMGNLKVMKAEYGSAIEIFKFGIHNCSARQKKLKHEFLINIGKTYHHWGNALINKKKIDKEEVTQKFQQAYRYYNKALRLTEAADARDDLAKLCVYFANVMEFFYGSDHKKCQSLLKEARKHYRAVLRHGMDDMVGLSTADITLAGIYLAYCSGKLGKFDEAISWVNMALANGEEASKAHFIKAAILALEFGAMQENGALKSKLNKVKKECINNLKLADELSSDSKANLLKAAIDEPDFRSMQAILKEEIKVGS